MNDTVPKTAKRRQKPAGSGGSRAGVPNKATADARQAIASFVDGNAHRLVNWLDQVSGGIPHPDPDKEGQYIVPPNPSKAFELFQSVVEYHIPKLARTESFVEQTTEISGHIEIRPKLTKEEWMQAHGLGSTARTTS